ncbi:hypothetical protein AHMF7616_00743 [Adhaeribacter pallidiroseus]|uniref:Restriction endonuclease type II NotI domain-containing protein n=2 Tax=Adhaeribacter pallidiroseus TaxID=2072847 RepID=A0A369QCI6_9BACT|nr:hypothetical protein AHMF7616_00743 [Adhaeribacter pallidiroseus]
MDMVLAEMDEWGEIHKFVSVELQAVDITGSYFPAYNALTNSEMLERAPTYSFNWKNVYKRYVTQLIDKGFQHSMWKTIIVSVMQDTVLERILQIGNIASSPINESNVVFLGYKFVEDEFNGRFTPELSIIKGTTHANIVSGTLYKNSIDINDVKRRLKDKLTSRH